MLLNLIITGVGGQGNVLASQILGRAAVNKGFQVTIGETFGLSQRGGAVMSHIRLSDGKSYGPVIPPNMADVIVGLEPLETLRVFPEYAKKNSTLIVNARPIYPLNVIAGDVDYPELPWIRDALDRDGNRLFWLKATHLAVELGGPIMLNMIMLGALCELPGVPLKKEDIQEVLSAVFPESRLKGNFRALEIGGGLIRDYEN
ncbi:MAG: indolepyruvate oxidoreductase subunit beta [Desulfatiglandaceae bacterium]|jgi:indolepyruvate ferredoxin oxidoreductase beta subunit